MKRYMMSVSDEVFAELEKERKESKLDSVQEVTRQIVSDYFRQKNQPRPPDSSFLPV